MGKRCPILILTLLLGLVVGLAGGVHAQQTPVKPPPAQQQPAKPATIMDLLGKVTLDQVKKAHPGGKETKVRPQANTVLASLKAETRYVLPKGESIYYFNSQGVLVRFATTPRRKITKQDLLKDFPGLQFSKPSSGQAAVGFMQRSPTIRQGFYLSDDGKEIVLSTYDYTGK